MVEDLFLKLTWKACITTTRAGHAGAFCDGSGKIEGIIEAC